MGLPPVGSNRSPVATTQTNAPTGPVRLGVTGESKPQDIAKAFEKYGLEADGPTAGDGKGPGSQYAAQLGGIQSKASRTAALNKVETKMNEYMQSHPNASKTEIAAEAKKQLMTQTLMYKHLEKSIMDMAQKSIERIRDTFSDS